MRYGYMLKRGSTIIPFGNLTGMPKFDDDFKKAYHTQPYWGLNSWWKREENIDFLLRKEV